MADRPTAAERVTHLTERAERTRLTYEEGRILREAAKELTADLERARRVAVALENDNARQEAELRDLRGALDWQTSCLTCARVLKSSYAETARAERAEQQLAAVRALHTSSQETRGVGRGSPWRPYCDHCHQDWPCATIRALDGAQQPATGEGDRPREQRHRPTHPDGTPYRYHEIVAEGWGHCDGCGLWTTATPSTPHDCQAPINVAATGEGDR